MTAEEQDFEMYKGETKKIQPTDNDEQGVRDEDNGGTVDLTGASIEWVLRERPDGTDVISKSLSGGGISIIGAASDGVFEVLLEPSDTSSIDADHYWYKSQIEDAAGNVSLVTTGTIEVKEAGS